MRQSITVMRCRPEAALSAEPCVTMSRIEHFLAGAMTSMAMRTALMASTICQATCLSCNIESLRVVYGAALSPSLHRSMPCDGHSWGDSRTTMQCSKGMSANLWQLNTCAGQTSNEPLPVRAAWGIVVVLEVCAECLSVVARLLVHEDDVSIVHSVQLQMRRPPASAVSLHQRLRLWRSLSSSSSTPSHAKGQEPYT